MRRIALAALLGLPGCLFDPVIPVEAHLACAIDADCPAEALCVVGRGTPVEALRAPSPGVLDVTITPTLVGRGGTVEVSFAVDAALHEAPIVDVEVGRPVRLDGTGLRDGRYGFASVVDGTEAPGDAPLTATLVDQLGRTSTVSLGTFTLDLLDPTFINAVVARERVGRGLDIHVEATLDAPARVTAGLRFDDGTDIPLALTVTGLRARATAVADDRLPSGERAAIVLRGIDAAGNDSGEVVFGTVVVDLDAPSLSAEPLPPTVRPRDLVRFIVSSDEVVVAPTLTIEGIGAPQALLPNVGAGGTVGWSWFVPDPGADTDVTVTAGAFVDAAGNAAALAPWTLRIDRGGTRHDRPCASSPRHRRRAVAVPSDRGAGRAAVAERSDPLGGARRQRPRPARHRRAWWCRRASAQPRLRPGLPAGLRRGRQHRAGVAGAALAPSSSSDSTVA
jgi:hypothetical protein